MVWGYIIGSRGRNTGVYRDMKVEEGLLIQICILHQDDGVFLVSVLYATPVVNSWTNVKRIAHISDISSPRSNLDLMVPG